MDDSPASLFHGVLARHESPLVVEIGTKRSNALRSTVHGDLANGHKTIGLDLETGPDVDVVGDAHRFPFANASVHGLIACSVFEHLERPWEVAAEIGRIVIPGGGVYVETHQTFPLHAYEKDYFRFSIEGLQSLFGKGWMTLHATYGNPAKIEAEGANTDGYPAFLSVRLVAYKQ